MSQYDALKSLIDHVDESSVAYVDYKNDNEHIVISKEVPKKEVTAFPAPAVQPVVSGTTDSSPQVSSVTDESGAQNQAQATGIDIKSPMVGVAYLQPEPDADVYVKVGDQVKKGDTICIIEAMKLMNEIEAPEDGVITEILVDNEEVVEYDQPLMRYEPLN